MVSRARLTHKAADFTTAALSRRKTTTVGGNKKGIRYMREVEGRRSIERGGRKEGRRKEDPESRYRSRRQADARQPNIFAGFRKHRFDGCVEVLTTHVTSCGVLLDVTGSATCAVIDCRGKRTAVKHLSPRSLNTRRCVCTSTAQSTHVTTTCHVVCL